MKRGVKGGVWGGHVRLLWEMFGAIGRHLGALLRICLPALAFTAGGMALANGAQPENMLWRGVLAGLLVVAVVNAHRVLVGGPPPRWFGLRGVWRHVVKYVRECFLLASLFSVPMVLLYLGSFYPVMLLKGEGVLRASAGYLVVPIVFSALKYVAFGRLGLGLVEAAVRVPLRWNAGIGVAQSWALTRADAGQVLIASGVLGLADFLLRKAVSGRLPASSPLAEPLEVLLWGLSAVLMLSLVSVLYLRAQARGAVA